jgi:hypothetical protein
MHKETAEYAAMDEKYEPEAKRWMAYYIQKSGNVSSLRQESSQWLQDYECKGVILPANDEDSYKNLIATSALFASQIRLGPLDTFFLSIKELHDSGYGEIANAMLGRLFSQAVTYEELLQISKEYTQAIRCEPAEGVSSIESLTPREKYIKEQKDLDKLMEEMDARSDARSKETPEEARKRWENRVKNTQPIIVIP